MRVLRPCCRRIDQAEGTDGAKSCSVCLGKGEQGKAARAEDGASHVSAEGLEQAARPLAITRHDVWRDYARLHRCQYFG